MEGKKLTILLLIILIFNGCEIKNTFKKAKIPEIAFPIEVNDKVVRVDISNYFKADIKLYNATVDETMSCDILSDSTTIVLKGRRLLRPFSNLHLKSNIGKIDMILKLTGCCSGKKGAPYIYGESKAENKFYFTIENSYDKLFVYVNNRLLPDKKIYKEGKFHYIKISKAITKTEESTLRICAYHNLNGRSNVFSVALRNGQLIKSEEVSNAEIYKNLYDDKDYLKLYKEALNTFIYYKNNFSYLDSLVNKGICQYGEYRIFNKNLSKRYYTVSELPLSSLDKNISNILTAYKKPRIYKGTTKRLNQLNTFLLTTPGPASFYVESRYENIKHDNFEFSLKKVEDLRKTDLSLIYGDYKAIISDNLTYAYVRRYLKQFCIVVFNRSKYLKRKSINLHHSFSHTNGKALFNSRFDINGGKLIIEMQPYSVELIYGQILK